MPWWFTSWRSHDWKVFEWVTNFFTHFFTHLLSSSSFRHWKTSRRKQPISIVTLQSFNKFQSRNSTNNNNNLLQGLVDVEGLVVVEGLVGVDGLVDMVGLTWCLAWETSDVFRVTNFNFKMMLQLTSSALLSCVSHFFILKGLRGLPHLGWIKLSLSQLIHGVTWILSCGY